MDCPLCKVDGFFENDLFKVLLVDDGGYVRVVTKDHVKELTDLEESEAIGLFRAVMEIERVMREFIKPDKVNIASFGNQVPHLHIHIIPRFKNDPAWPGSSFCVEDFKTPKIDTKTYKEKIVECLKSL